MWQLELVDEKGKAITEQEYLEDCLKPKEGASAAVKEQNDTRTALTELFRKRSCIALAHPTLGTKLKPEALKSLPELSKLAPGASVTFHRYCGCHRYCDCIAALLHHCYPCIAAVAAT